jgi:hypothetical protein
MDVFRKFATDESLEVTGVWRLLGEGAKVLVARSGNRAYANLLTKMVEQHQQALDLKDGSANDLSDQIMIEVMAETVLLGWEHVEFKGKDLEYSEANAKMLLGVKDFRRHIAKLSEDIEQYRVREDLAAGEA